MIGTFDRQLLNRIFYTGNLIFNNKGKAIPQDLIDNLNHSLILVSVTEFEIKEMTYEDRPDRPRIRLTFIFNNREYDFPITDPYFLNAYGQNPHFLQERNPILLTISLAIEWEGWYYKLVAGVM